MVTEHVNIYIYIYIYVLASADLCISMHKKARFSMAWPLRKDDKEVISRIISDRSIDESGMGSRTSKPPSVARGGVTVVSCAGWEPDSPSVTSGVAPS